MLGLAYRILAVRSASKARAPMGCMMPEHSKGTLDARKIRLVQLRPLVLVLVAACMASAWSAETRVYRAQHRPVGELALLAEAALGDEGHVAVDYTAAATELILAPGETVVVGSIDQEGDGKEVDRLGGVSTRRASEEQVLFVSVSIEGPSRR